MMQYMGAGWPGQYPEGHPSMHSTPMAHAWYQAHGEHPSNPASEVLSSGILPILCTCTADVAVLWGGT